MQLYTWTFPPTCWSRRREWFPRNWFRKQRNKPSSDQWHVNRHRRPWICSEQAKGCDHPADYWPHGHGIWQTQVLKWGTRHGRTGKRSEWQLSFLKMVVIMPFSVKSYEGKEANGEEFLLFRNIFKEILSICWLWKYH